jgi:hypothetical protein
MGVTATAIYYYNLCILEKTARLLGKITDASRYKALAVEVRQAFNTQFFNRKTNNYATGSQTANAMAIYMQLVLPEHKTAVLNNIISDIRKNKNSLTSGDIGYRYLLRVLEQEGRSDVINEMNSNPDVPGYGYQLAQGATALTESWQALPSVSNNHLMLGHLMEWFYSGIGGIRQEENSIAFKQIVIHPEIVQGLTHAETSYASPYGRITTKWKVESKGLQLEVDYRRWQGCPVACCKRPCPDPDRIWKISIYRTIIINPCPIIKSFNSLFFSVSYPPLQWHNLLRSVRSVRKRCSSFTKK